MAKRAKKDLENSAAGGLLSSLNFVSVASRDTGEDYQQHVVLYKNFAVAFDGLIAAGAPIQEEVTACPNAHKLIQALKTCQEELSLTFLDKTKRVSITSGPFRALIPCLEISQMHYTQPDIVLTTLTPELVAGLSLIVGVANAASDHAMAKTVLLEANTITASNGHIIVQAWHGIDLPPRLVLPREFCAAVAKCGREIAGFGYSERSVTFYFADGAWIKTLRTTDNWPDSEALGRVLGAIPADVTPLDPELWAALDAVEPHCDGRVYLGGGYVSSDPKRQDGATYAVDSLTADAIFNPKYLRMIQKVATHFSYTKDSNAGYFYGDKLRGAVMKCR